MSKRLEILVVGEIYNFSPIQVDYNPAKNKEPFIGIFIEKIIDPSGWRQPQYKVYGQGRQRVLWSTRWKAVHISNL